MPLCFSVVICVGGVEKSSLFDFNLYISSSLRIPVCFVFNGWCDSA